MSVYAVQITPDETHPDIGEETGQHTPVEAYAAALAWVNEQRADAAEQGREYVGPLDRLVAGVAGNSQLCALALSARMSSVGETTATTRRLPRFDQELIDLPAAVRAFQQYFDAGAYPNLENSISDAVEYQVDNGLTADSNWE
jgi:hypothetical protein